MSSLIGFVVTFIVGREASVKHLVEALSSRVKHAVIVQFQQDRHLILATRFAKVRGPVSDESVETTAERQVVTNDLFRLM